MADMKALFTQRFDAARAALTQGDEPAAAESLHWAIVAARSNPGLRLELASALFHLGKLSRKFGRAGEAEAEQLLTEALAISEELFGKQHTALVPPLTELSRLHVQRSQYARAEEALHCLLAIARLKGEENADVATVLADLGVVKRKLGDNASAETLFRDALRIREKVLEPNHMITVFTLEQLSETCVARGNIGEALALLQRALPTREATLGPGHETVRVVRSRIAELELQVAIAADAAAVTAARAARGPIPTPAFIKRTPENPANASSTTVTTPPGSTEMEFLGERESPTRRPSAPLRERPKTPVVTAAVAAASLMASPIQTPSASQIAIAARESAQPSTSASGAESDAAQRDVVLADVARHEVASDEPALGNGNLAVAAVSAESTDWADAPKPAPKKRMVLYASGAVAAAAAIMIAALMLRPSAGGGASGGANRPSKETSTTQQRPSAMTVAAGGTAAVTTASAAAAAVVTPGAPRADSLRAANAAPAPAVPAAPAAQPAQRPTESAAPELRAPHVQLGPMNIPIPAANVDSIMRSVPERQRAADSERTGAPVAAARPASVDVEDVAVPPKIIGRPPAPRFPDELLHAPKPGGEVLVRFKVNEFGRVDVASMLVVRSDHELFTDAVREVLPNFRFEPARTRAPESRPVAAWVTVPFRFTARK